MGYWEPNSELPEEQQLLLTTKLSLVSVAHFKNEIAFWIFFLVLYMFSTLINYIVSLGLHLSKETKDLHNENLKKIERDTAI